MLNLYRLNKFSDKTFQFSVLDDIDIHKTVLRIKTNANGHDEVKTKMFVIYGPHLNTIFSHIVNYVLIQLHFLTYGNISL